jgi:hypothetical protein
MFGKLKTILGGKPPEAEARKQAVVPEVTWVPGEKNQYPGSTLSVMQSLNRAI